MSKNSERFTESNCIKKMLIGLPSANNKKFVRTNDACCAVPDVYLDSCWLEYWNAQQNYSVI